MPGIGEQRQRVLYEADNGLDDHEKQIQRDGEDKDALQRTACGYGGMMVVMMAMMMPLMMCVVMMFHIFLSFYSAYTSAKIRNVSCNSVAKSTRVRQKQKADYPKLRFLSMKKRA